jgi:hypothetical protein
MTTIAGVGAILVGASRFAPDVFELPFFMLMIGGGTLFWTSRRSQSESTAGAS